MASINDFLKNIKDKWSSISKSEKFNLISVISLLIVLPMVVGGVLTVKYLGSKADEPITPPITPPLYTPSPTPTPTQSEHFIQIITPNGGETISQGQRYQIVWNSSHTFSDVSLYYAITGGFSGVIASHIADTGSFVWQANPVYGIGQYKIYINGDINGYNYANDNSDDYFQIVHQASPTPTPTPTPTATPTATPIVTATPTIVPTSTPTTIPTTNINPIISTSLLPIARVKRSYTAIITGYDKNINDNLTMTATGWPDSIKLEGCSSKITSSRKTIQCLYSGISKRFGLNNISITLTDDKGAMVKKTLLLYTNFY